MIIGIYLVIVNFVIPQIGTYALALLEPVMIVFITLMGILMLFGAVGIHISSGFGATIAGGIVRGVGWLFTQLFDAIAWIFRQLWYGVPRIFRGSRGLYLAHCSRNVANLLAGVTTVAVVALII